MNMTVAGLAHPKPESRKRVKGRKDRMATAVAKRVRAACVVRDGDCRLLQAEMHINGNDDFVVNPRPWHHCYSQSEWAHFGEKKRARTRGQAAEVRHTTAGSLILCRDMHQAYDAGDLKITALTRKGCNGRLKFRLNGGI